ncbi:MAG: gliding motility lipoprotein GldH [Prolixibacteraceae bacterium]|nr:gliding motility lipoprotein GldH [Prolixibacteraceae bacterium]
MIKETQGTAGQTTRRREGNPTIKAAVLLLAVILFAACDRHRVYESFYSSKDAAWDKYSIARFEIPISQKNRNYNLYINCRNLENYPYSNLWLFIDIMSPDSLTIRDTLEFQLAQPNGKWTGRGTGGVYENQFAYKTNVFFPDTGTYLFQVQHGMRVDELRGLKDIGIRVEYTY